MTNYFKKLPTVYYNNAPAKNIMARADLSKYTRNNGVNFYPHTMDDGDRVDMVSHLYYDDSDFSWLIYFANDIIDPYYDVVLDEQSFIDHIDDKYGSMAEASYNTKYYKNNWAENLDHVIDVPGYEALPSNLRKYWSPLNDANFRIIAYQRKHADWIVNTNRIIQLNVEGNNQITVGDTVTRVSGQSILASGFVNFANSSSITVQHINGEFANVAYVVNSRYTNNTANVTSIVAITENLEPAEEIYYSPVSYLDFEEEQNSKKKEIVLIDDRLAEQASSELRKVLRN